MMNTGRGFRDPGREQAPATRFPALRRLRGSQTSARDAHCANPPSSPRRTFHRPRCLHKWPPPPPIITEHSLRARAMDRSPGAR
jgi:hypothetical protein